MEREEETGDHDGKREVEGERERKIGRGRKRGGVKGEEEEVGGGVE